MCDVSCLFAAFVFVAYCISYGRSVGVGFSLICFLAFVLFSGSYCLFLMFYHI